MTQASLFPCRPLATPLSLRSATVTIARLLTGLIEKEVKDKVPPAVLQLISNLMANQATASLQKLNTWVAPYLKPTKTLAENVTSAVALDWRASPELELLNYAVDGVVGADGPLGLDGLVDLATHGSGQINHTLGKTITFPVDVFDKPNNRTYDLANVSITFIGVNVSGLDSLTGLRLLEPLPGAADAHSLLAGLALDEAAVDVGVSIKVTPLAQLLDAPPLVENFTFALDAKKLAPSALLLLALNGTALRDLTPYDLSMPLCLLTPLLDAGVRSLGLNISGALALSLTSAGGDIEQDIDKAINDLLKLVTQTFAPVIPAVSDGLLGGPLRDMANNVVHGLVDDLKPYPGFASTCHVPPAAPPPSAADAIDWKASTSLDLLDFVVDGIVGADGPLGVDRLVRLLTDNTSALTFNLSGKVPPLVLPVPGVGNVSVALGALNVSGLDSLSALDLAVPEDAGKPTADHADLVTAVMMEKLKLSVDVAVGVAPAPPAAAGMVEATAVAAVAATAASTSTLRLAISLADLGANVTGRLAVNRSGLAALQLNQLLGAPFNCTLDQFENVSLTSLRATMTVSTMSVDGRAPWERSGGVSHAALPRPATFALDGLLAQLLVAKATTAMQAALIKPRDCPAAEPLPPPPPPSPDALDWRANYGLEIFDLAVATAGPPGIDKLVGLATHGSGAVQIKIGKTVNLGPIAVTIGQLNISGLDSFDTLRLLEPVPSDRAALASAIGMKHLNLSVDLDLALASSSSSAASPAASPAVLPAAASALAASGMLASSGMAMRIGATLDAIELEATGRLALNSSGVEHLQLQQLPNPNCSIKQVLDARLLSLGATATLSALTIDAKSASADASSASHVALPRPTTLALPPLLSELLSVFISNKVDAILGAAESAGACPTPPPYVPEIVDVRHDKGVQKLEWFFDEFLGNASYNTSYDAMIDKLSKLLGLPPGQLGLPFKFLDVWMTDPKVGQIGIQLSDLKLTGLDSVYAVELMEPAGASLLTHSLSLGGYAPIIAQMHMRLYLGDHPAGWHSFDVRLDLRNVSLDMATPIALDSAAFGYLTLGQVLTSPDCLAKPIVNLSLDATQTNLTVHQPRTGGLNVDLTRANATADLPPGWARLPDLLPVLGMLTRGVSEMIDDKIQQHLGKAHAKCDGTSYNPPPPPPKPTTSNVLAAAIAIVMVVVPFGIGLYVGLLERRKRLHRLERKAARSSALHNGGSGDMSVEPLAAPSVGASAPCTNASIVEDDEDDDVDDDEQLPPAGSVTPAGLDSGPMPGMPRANGAQSPTMIVAWAAQSEADPPPLCSPCARFATSLSQQPMYRNSCWAILVPATIFGTIALFLVSAVPPMGRGASVDVLLQLAGEPIELLNVFSFTLTGSIHDSWQAGVYPLSLLIGLMSGVWPYLKLVLMLFCWWAPASWMPPKRCEVILRALDALGKWSLLDFDMLMMMAVAFHIHVEAPSSPPYSAGPAPLEATVQVTPQFGMYGFLTAVSLSLIMSHVLLALQRNATAQAAERAGKSAATGRRLSLSDPDSPDARGWLQSVPPMPVRRYRFKRPDLGALCRRANGAAACATNAGGGAGGGDCGDANAAVAAARDPARARPLSCAMQLAMVALLGVSALAIVGACDVHTFSIRIGGLAGAALGAGAGPTPYSLIDVGNLLPRISSQAPPAALRLFQGVFFLICLVVPLLWLAILTTLWLVPLRIPTQRRLFVAAEVAHAWAALDVFILTVIASLLELDQFAQFIVGDECDGIDAALRTYFDYTVGGDKAEERCFVVDARLEGGIWLLFCASLVSMVCGHAVMHGGIEALEDHERRLGRQRARSVTATGEPPHPAASTAAPAGQLGAPLLPPAEAVGRSES